MLKHIYTKHLHHYCACSQVEITVEGKFKCRLTQMAYNIGNSATKPPAALLLVHPFLKEQKTLGKMPNETSNNLPSI